MKKIFFLPFFCFLSALGSLKASNSSHPFEPEKSLTVNPRDLVLSPEEQKEQNAKIAKLVEESRLKRKRIAQQQRERALIYGEKPPVETEEFFDALRMTYQIINQNSQESEEFHQNTIRIRRGILTLAANLLRKPVPETPEGKGFTETEWPHQEQIIWGEICGLIHQHNGEYGAIKEEISRHQKSIIDLQEKRASKISFIPFVFNGAFNESEDPDTSLTPFLRDNEQEATQLKTQLAEKQKDLGQSSNSLPSKKQERLNQEIQSLESQVIWKKTVSIFILGLDTAQRCGWDNWTRTCLVAGYLDASKSYQASLEIKTSRP